MVRSMFIPDVTHGTCLPPVACTAHDLVRHRALLLRPSGIGKWVIAAAVQKQYEGRALRRCIRLDELADLPSRLTSSTVAQCVQSGGTR
jgi:hypothetical protein